jgi:hypothetical protein
MLTRLRPTRTEAQESVKIISDFDSLLTEQVGFKFRGKIHVLNPVDVKNFMQITIAYRNLLQMIEARSEGSSLTDDEVYQKYYDLIHPIVPSITYAEMRAMTLVMLNNLINLVFRQLSGDPSLYEKDEKKNLFKP